MVPLKQVQLKLIELKYDLGPGKADGVAGNMTLAAIAKFQKDKNLDVKWPGTLGPLTYVALGFNTNISNIINPPWIAHAKSLLGLHEVKDAKKLDKILHLDASETAWCGAFVGMSISVSLPKEPLPSNPLGSRNWLNFGKEISDPKLGAVAVFYRGDKNGWQGHVGFVVGQDKTCLHILGGNQSDKVSIARVKKDRLLGYRWPSTFGLPPKDNLPFTTINATITTNEA